LVAAILFLADGNHEFAGGLAFMGMCVWPDISEYWKARSKKD